MIDVHYWPTPNGHKITLALEELVELGAALPYTLQPVNIGTGDQFKPDYLRISPNNKMPAIVDHEPAGGGAPLSVFESGAILLYIAEKAGATRPGALLPADPRARIEALEWLFWQVGGLGPMAGQYGHFNVYAPDPIAYAIDRYTRETQRLLGVLDKRLQGREFIAGTAYSIADAACYPWINPYKAAPIDLAPYPDLQRWHAAIAGRPATGRAYALAAQVNPAADKPMDEAQRKLLFGHAPK